MPLLVNRNGMGKMSVKQKQTFQKQVIRAFLPATILAILFSGFMMYIQASSQVKKNAKYLIASTTRQTANIIDDKLEHTVGKCIELGKTMELWRMVNHPYDNSGKFSEYQDMIYVHEYLQSIYNDSNGVIDSIAFQTSYGNRLNVYYDMVYSYSELGSDNFGEQETKKLYWLNVHIDEVFSTKIPREVISLVIPYDNSKRVHSGTLVVNFKKEYFQKILSDTEISRNGYVFLLSADGILMPGGRKGTYLLEEQLEELRELSGSGEYMLSEEEELYDIHYTPLKTNGWMVVSVTPHSDLYSTLNSFKVVFTLVIMAAALFSFLVSIFSSRYISRPVKILSDQVVAFENNRDVVFGVDAGYEITTLAGGLNHLKDTIDQLLIQVREEQKQKSHLELMIMQAQIKPHFLYNTLGSIKALSDLQESEKASSMCEALIQFYRITLSNGMSVITLGMEVELIQNYMKILEYRYGDKFEYSFDVSEQLKKIKIPRMSLQPLIENAVYHGIKPREGKGIILVSCEIRHSFISIKVFDDGVGMDSESLQCLRDDIKKEEVAPGKQGGFALRNVYMRLKGFYGDSVDMKIDSVKDVYTQICIDVPLDSVEENVYVQTDDCG